VLGYRVRPFPATLVSEIPHPDELRTRFYSQDMLQSHRVHQYYKHVKLDVLRLTREPLPIPLRRQIYDTIREKLEEIESGERETAVLSVNLPSFIVAPPPSDRTYTREDTSFIDRKIQYRFRVGTEMKGP